MYSDLTDLKGLCQSFGSDEIDMQGEISNREMELVVGDQMVDVVASGRGSLPALRGTVMYIRSLNWEKLRSDREF